MVWRIHQVDLKFTCISTLTYTVFKVKRRNSLEFGSIVASGFYLRDISSHCLLSIDKWSQRPYIHCCGRGCVGMVKRFKNWPSGDLDFKTPKSFTSWMTTVSLSFLNSKITDCMIGWFWRSISDRRHESLQFSELFNYFWCLHKEWISLIYLLIYSFNYSFIHS